ncbi:MAG: hypothetical protein J3K34DRAFT_466805 [Monoraphidium minutum]|nr:MAG: hypothetical protein J3K34DRAFT_466805 [Monoraphidium minutum]
MPAAGGANGSGGAAPNDGQPNGNGGNGGGGGDPARAATGGGGGRWSAGAGGGGGGGWWPGFGGFNWGGGGGGGGPFEGLTPVAVAWAFLIAIVLRRLFPDWGGGARAAGGGGGGAPDEAAAAAGGKSGVATKDDVMILKRLLREVFQEQLGIKGRLAAAEEAAAHELEPGDVYDESVAAGGWGGAFAAARGGACGGPPARGRARAAGAARGGAAALLSHGDGGAAAAALAEQMGAGGDARLDLWLHTVLGDEGAGADESGAAALQQPPPATAATHDASALPPRQAPRGARARQRLTARLAQGADAGVLQLQQLLYRAELGRRVRLLLAPLGGRLSDAAPGANPHAPRHYGSTAAFRAGHGLAAPGEGGCGGAVAFLDGALSASAGHFVKRRGGGGGDGGAPGGGGGGGARHSSCAQLSVTGRGGAALSVVTGVQSGGGGDAGGGSVPLLGGLMRFEGASVPCGGRGGGAAAGGAKGAAGVEASVGLVGAAPLGDAFVASAWAEGRVGGGAGGGGGGRALGWGVGLHSQPDAGGRAVGFVLARPTAPGGGGGGGGGGAPLVCELAWRLPVADGLELSPGAVVVRGAGGGAATAVRLGAGWRF